MLEIDKKSIDSLIHSIIIKILLIVGINSIIEETIYLNDIDLL